LHPRGSRRKVRILIEFLEIRHAVGYAVTDDVREAVIMLPEWAWMEAIDADAGLRDGAQVAETPTSRSRSAAWPPPAARRRRERVKKAQASGQKIRTDQASQASATWTAGMRVLVRRERPHPGARLDVFEERDG
jgi:hypothetical protein